MLNIELVYVNYDFIWFHFKLFLPFRSTVKDALYKTNIISLCPDIVGKVIGIFSEKVSLETLLNDGDRIEIYEFLLVSPKEIRRNRIKNRIK
ncbi:RnfH family protein [Candidatus Legionella polyplacis]|uniref:UPF0125 protein RQL39_02150 n=1 Tax=Candidatus Legionella polyplacis TaxID=2005262 RepID=A0ABZ2GWF0_9GAMM